MKNLFVYYVAIVLPVVLLAYALKNHWVSNEWFVVLLFSYFFYRQCTDAARLVALGVIDKLSWSVLCNPFLQMKHFRKLYWFS